MKIKLVDGSVYPAARAEVTNGRLEIDFKDKSCEEIQTLSSVPENLANIRLLTDEGEIYGEIPGYTVYSGVMLYGETRTLILTHQTDPVMDRLTSAEAKALEANTLAQSAKEETEMLTQCILEMSEKLYE